MVMSVDLSGFYLCYLCHGNIKVIFTKNGGFMTISCVRTAGNRK